MSATVAFYHSCANRNQAKMTVKSRGGMFRNERKSLKHYCFADWQGALSFSTLGVDGGTAVSYTHLTLPTSCCV